MNEWLNPTFSGRLCLTLLHSIWLVATFTAIACGINHLTGKRSAEWSYILFSSALILSVSALPITWWCVDIDNAVSNGIHAMSTPSTANSVVTPRDIPKPLNRSTSGSADDVQIAIPMAGVDNTPGRSKPNPASQELENWLGIAPSLVAVYFCGVFVMLLRFAGALRSCRQSHHRATAITNGPLANFVDELSQRWAMRVSPILMQVKDTAVPQVIGLFKPIILLPMSAVNELSIEELELILTHELAHVRRYDMWIHLVQRLAEIVLFFNPALWLLNRRISTVREYCCDDITCQAAGEPQPEIRYANAMLRILEVTTVAPKPQLTALAATGRSPSEVRRRIARLFNQPINEPLRMSRSGFFACVVSLAVLLISTNLWTAESEPIEESQPTSQSGPAQKTDTDDVPEKLFRLFVAGPDGQPVADASVEFRGSPKLDEQQIRRGTFDRKGSYGTFVKTDKNGRVTISLLDEQPSLRFSIKKSGYGPYWTDWSSRQHPEDLPERFTARLNNAWRVGGIVVDKNGKPVAGVEVHPSVDYKKRPGDRKHMGVGTNLKTDENGA